MTEIPQTSMRTKSTARLWDNPNDAPMSLGCWKCIDRADCGGAHKSASFYDCNDYCTCSDKANCDTVCRGNPANFVARVREVNGLDLKASRRVTPLTMEALPPMIPIIERKSKRAQPLNFPVAAVPFYSLIDLDSGVLKYQSRKALAEKFGIHPACRLVISGVARDRKIERYWELRNRSELLRQISALRPSLITPPNFSVLTDVPRTDNLHAMKRILHCWIEMAEAGLPAALHINARTESDYFRWAELIAERDEINAITVEFATGAGFGQRIHWHVDQLRNLARYVPRPLHLTVRGGARVLNDLRNDFDYLTILDTHGYSKTRCRKKAYFDHAGRLRWHHSPTAEHEPLDSLLQHNVHTLFSHYACEEREFKDRQRTESALLRPTTDYRNHESA